MKWCKGEQMLRETCLVEQAEYVEVFSTHGGGWLVKRIVGSDVSSVC